MTSLLNGINVPQLYDSLETDNKIDTTHRKQAQKYQKVVLITVNANMTNNSNKTVYYFVTETFFQRHTKWSMFVH